jgi:hypothetical protein
MSLVRAGLIAFGSLVVSLLGTGCPKPTQETPDAAVEAGPTDAAGGGDAATGDVDSYLGGPPMPLAEKLCEALTSLPEKKRAACCNTTPGATITAGCTRHLSAALRHDALEVDEKDVDACVAAFEKTLEGCDWVGPFVPGPPAACQGLLKGKRAAGQTCRSSLECTGNLRCKDYGPNAIGKCGAPGVSDEASCGGSVDALATYTRQTDLDKRHPECNERCIRRKCQAPLHEGAGCVVTSECRDGAQCMAPPGAPAQKHGYIPTKQCVAVVLPEKEGAPCPGGACAGTLACIRGKCAPRKNTGAACNDEFECRGGCLKDGGTQGTCGPRCESR